MTTVWPWSFYAQVLTRLNAIDAKLGKLMSDQSHLDADVQAEEASVAAIGTAVSNVAAEIAALKAGNPAVNFAGLDQAVTDLGNATASVQGLEPPPA
jgi:hypothetical protein